MEAQSLAASASTSPPSLEAQVVLLMLLSAVKAQMTLGLLHHQSRHHQNLDSKEAEPMFNKCDYLH